MSNLESKKISEAFELLLVGNLSSSLIAREYLLGADEGNELTPDWRIDLVSYLRIINVSTSEWTQNIDNIICTLFKALSDERKFFRGQLREIANMKDRKVFSAEVRAEQEDHILNALLHYFQNQK